MPALSAGVAAYPSGLAARALILLAEHLRGLVGDDIPPSRAVEAARLLPLISDARLQGYKGEFRHRLTPKPPNGRGMGAITATETMTNPFPSRSYAAVASKMRHRGRAGIGLRIS